MSHDPAYSDLSHEELLALRDRMDDHTPADAFVAAFPAYHYRAHKDAGRPARRPATNPQETTP